MVAVVSSSGYGVGTSGEVSGISKVLLVTVALIVVSAGKHVCMNIHNKHTAQMEYKLLNKKIKDNLSQTA